MDAIYDPISRSLMHVAQQQRVRPAVKIKDRSKENCAIERELGAVEEMSREQDSGLRNKSINIYVRHNGGMEIISAVERCSQSYPRKCLINRRTINMSRWSSYQRGPFAMVLVYQLARSCGRVRREYSGNRRGFCRG